MSFLIAPINEYFHVLFSARGQWTANTASIHVWSTIQTHFEDRDLFLLLVLRPPLHNLRLFGNFHKAWPSSAPMQILGIKCPWLAEFQIFTGILHIVETDHASYVWAVLREAQHQRLNFHVGVWSLTTHRCVLILSKACYVPIRWLWFASCFWSAKSEAGRHASYGRTNLALAGNVSITKQGGPTYQWALNKQFYSGVSVCIRKGKLVHQPRPQRCRAHALSGYVRFNDHLWV